MGAFGLPDIPGHIMTNQADGGFNRYFCSCGESIWCGTKKDGTANSWGKKAWKDHCDLKTTPDDFFVEIGTVQKQRVKWTVNVMSTRHPDFIKYNVPTRGYVSNWYENRIAKDPNYRAFAVCIAKSGKSRWVVHRILESRDGALKSATDMVRKADNSHDTELTHSDGTPVVEVVSVDICKATSQILNEADEALASRDLLAIMNKRRELQDILNMGPLLTAKLAELERTLGSWISGPDN